MQVQYRWSMEMGEYATTRQRNTETMERETTSKRLPLPFNDTREKFFTTIREIKELRRGLSS